MVNLFVAIAGDNANAKFWIVNNPSLKVNGSLSDAISRANINISLVTEHRGQFRRGNLSLRDTKGWATSF